MKLFQRLLVAPAALGLVSPLAATAGELNLEGVNQYATGQEQVTSIDQFSDVQPTDWAFQALSNLIERYGCVAGYPDGTYRGSRAMTRYEAAALLNACLDRITEVTDELKRLMKEFEKELAIVRGRVDGLEAKVGELEATQFSTTTKLKGKAVFVLGANTFSGDATSGNFNDLGDFVESRAFDVLTDELRALPADILAQVDIQFDGEGRLSDATLGSLQRAFGNDLGEILEDVADTRGGKDVINALLIDAFTGGRVRPGDKLADRAARYQGATAFTYDLKLDLDTSFTGKDLLRTRLRAGNFYDGDFISPWGGPVVGLNAMEAAFYSNDQNDVAIDRLFYQFPVGSSFTVTFGAKVRQDDMLAMWPSAYPSDTVLDFFTYAGAPGAYSLNNGAGGGIWWKSGDFSISANYVSANGNVGDPNSFDDPCGGIGTDCSASTGTAQIAWGNSTFGIAAAYTYTQGNGIAGLYQGNATPLATLGSSLADNMSSVGISAYWQPSWGWWFPSISGGWGINTHNSDVYDFIDGAQTQSWYVGLQWEDVFIKGNTFGMAVGQPTFLTQSGNEDILDPDDGNYAWEWWYKWQVTDNISVTPALYYLSVPYGQLQKGDNEDGFDNFGGLVKTTFRF
jgi:hypothetical protein